MTRDDLRRFRALDIDFESIGLLQSGAEDFAYFCTPADAEFVGRIGCDGVHFILLPGDERVFCVDPAMGEEGKYILPVGSDFREFAAEDAAARTSGDMAEYFVRKDAALAVIAGAFGLAPADPFDKVKAMQAAFDPAGLSWPDEYYDTLGLENPRRPEETEVIQGQAFAEAVFTVEKEDAMLPQDPYILLSFINTKLRDQYPSLDALCDGLDADKAELTERLAGAGYAYDPEVNQFK